MAASTATKVTWHEGFQSFFPVYIERKAAFFPKQLDFGALAHRDNKRVHQLLWLSCSELQLQAELKDTDNFAPHAHISYCHYTYHRACLMAMNCPKLPFEYYSEGEVKHFTFTLQLCLFYYGHVKKVCVTVCDEAPDEFAFISSAEGTSWQTMCHFNMTAVQIILLWN